METQSSVVGSQAQHLVNFNEVVKKHWAREELLQTPEGLKRVTKALLRNHMSAFTIKTFKTVSPGDVYLHNWHIDAISEHLQACQRRDIKRLIINIPPRTMKSISASVAFPAFLLGKDPTTKIICASYSSSLSVKHSVDCRAVVESEWYRDIFPNTIIADDQNTKNKFMTTKRGQRFTTSVGGSILGEGGDFLIMDDPVKADAAESDVERKAANDWFKTAFMTRLNDRNTGVVIVIMQRLHQDDLTGMLLSSGGWEHLCLPAVQEGATVRIYLGKNLYGKERYKTRAVGESLHKERFSEDVLEGLKKDLGSYAFAGQYQQQPSPKGGGLVKLEWFKRWKLDVQPNNARDFFETIVQSWDTAFKASDLNDPSACTTWGIIDNKYYLLDVDNNRLEYPDLKRRVISCADKWSPHVILVEDKASGQSLLQDLRRETGLPVVARKPVMDKVVRLSNVSALIEAGRCYLPEHASWLPDYETQLTGFPNTTHDDMVDSTSQFLDYCKSSLIMARIRSL